MCGDPPEKFMEWPVLFNGDGKPRCRICNYEHFGKTSDPTKSVCKKCIEPYDTLQKFQPEGKPEQIIDLSKYQ